MRKTIPVFLMVLCVLAWMLSVGAGAASPAEKPKAQAPAPAGAGAHEKKPAEGKTNDEYVIGSGDQLEIAVWKEEALTKQVIVLPDGRINFPLIGEVTAAGRTVGQVKEEIRTRLTPFVPEPTLSMDVKQVGSMVVYVIGKVNTPGRFVLSANINVLQALSTAGGLNPFAKRNKIKIFRQGRDGTEIFHFHYDEVVDGQNLQENITLRRGDVIVVP